MAGNLAVHLALLAIGAGPEIDAAQFAQIVKARSGALKSVVFLYEGQTHWVGPGNLGITPEQFDGDFQGTFLYRADGAAAVDTYYKQSNPKVSVVRKKRSVLNGKTESVRGVLDAKAPLDPARDIQFGKGSIASINDVAPLDFFWAWYWTEWGDLSRRNYTFQGWEEVDGRNCLRFQIDTWQGQTVPNENVQRFWVDVERNAHVLRFENHVDGKLAIKNDISLFELTGEDGQRCWLPARGRIAYYKMNEIYDRPVYEKTIDLVNGSARVNVELPDSLFTVRRDTALPAAGELEKLKASSESGRLRKQFEAQPAREPFKTDPASIRRKIDQNLAEADRQSKELEASSPARASWSWTTALQSVLALLGVATLVGVGYRKWSGR